MDRKIVFDSSQYPGPLTNELRECLRVAWRNVTVEEFYFWGNEDTRKARVVGALLSKHVYNPNEGVVRENCAVWTNGYVSDYSFAIVDPMNPKRDSALFMLFFIGGICLLILYSVLEKRG